MYSHSHSQDNLNFTLSPTMSSFVHSQPAMFPSSQPDEPNSPALFKDNITLIQSQISTVRSLAQEALNAMCVLIIPPIFPWLTEVHIVSKGAYQPGSSPAHAAGMIPFPYLSVEFIDNACRESRCIEAEPSDTKRAIAYHRRWLVASFIARCHRNSHRGAACGAG
jgi:hypothetical protein